MSKILVTAALASAVVAGAILPAAAGCHSCYAPQVYTAPVYAPTVQYRQVVAPARYGVVHRTVMVSPARRVVHRIPAEYGTMQKTVMVAPERVGFKAVCGACGPSYQQYVIPAQYGTVEKTVMTAPPRVQVEVIPAQYATVAQTVMVEPAKAYLVGYTGYNTGCNTCGY